MFEALGGSVGFGSDREDGGAVINEDGCTTLNGFGLFTFGVFLLHFLDEEAVLGVFMVNRV